LCRSAELFAFEGAHPWNIPFDDKLAQCHIFFSLIRTLTGKRSYPAAFPRSPHRRGDVNPLFVRLQTDFTIVRNARRRMNASRDHFPEENIGDGRPGRKRTPTRCVLEAVLWILNTGAQWHMTILRYVLVMQQGRRRLLAGTSSPVYAL